MTWNQRTMWAVAAILAGSSAGYACNKTPEQAHKDGQEAQQEANEKIGEARQEANDKIADARHDQVAAANDARKSAAEAQANANEKIRDANREATAPEGSTRRWAQAKLDDVDNMIDAASAKAQTAAPKAKAQFNTRIAEVKHERDALRTEVASLEAASGDHLDKAKERFDDQIDHVKSNIRNLEKSL